MCVAVSSKLSTKFRTREAVCSASVHVLIYLGLERELLFVVEDVDADVVALLPQLFASILAHGGHGNDFVRWNVCHCEHSTA